MDKFPEAFKRFEKQTNIDEIDTFRELLREFRIWAKEKYVGSQLQVSALMNEGSRLGLVNWKSQKIIRYNKEVIVHRSIKTGRFVKTR
jgi:hypothetical protein